MLSMKCIKPNTIKSKTFLLWEKTFRIEYTFLSLCELLRARFYKIVTNFCKFYEYTIQRQMLETDWQSCGSHASRHGPLRESDYEGNLMWSRACHDNKNDLNNNGFITRWSILVHSDSAGASDTVMKRQS